MAGFPGETHSCISTEPHTWLNRCCQHLQVPNHFFLNKVSCTVLLHRAWQVMQPVLRKNLICLWALPGLTGRYLGAAMHAGRALWVSAPKNNRKRPSASNPGWALQEQDTLQTTEPSRRQYQQKSTLRGRRGICPAKPSVTHRLPSTFVGKRRLRTKSKYEETNKEYNDHGRTTFIR